MKKFKLLGLIVAFLIVLMPLVFVGCGEEKQPEFEFELDGQYFTIGYNAGFATTQTGNKTIIRGNSFTLNISAEPYAAAILGDTSSIRAEIDATRYGLTEYNEETFENIETVGVFVSGIAEEKRGIILFVPADYYLITIFTAPAPNSKINFDLAEKMIKSFKLTNPKYLQGISKTNSENSTNNENNNNDTENPDINTPPIEIPAEAEEFSNEQITMTIPVGFELTSDDSRLTIIEPVAGSSSEIMSFSIQYVDLGKEMKADKYARSIKTQTNGDMKTKKYGETTFKEIVSKHGDYTEFHLVASRTSGLPLMISVVVTTDRLPADAIKLIETIEIK